MVDTKVGWYECKSEAAEDRDALWEERVSGREKAYRDTASEREIEEIQRERERKTRKKARDREKKREREGEGSKGKSQGKTDMSA